MERAFVFAVLFIGVAAPAWAGSDLDRDTRSRHDRASSSSSSGGSSSSSDDDDDDLDDDGWVSDGSGGYYYGDTPPQPKLVGQANLVAGVHFDRLSGTTGGQVVHQDGLGFGLALDLAVFGAGAPRFDRTGLALNVTFGRANLLEGYRPAGADYTSDLALSTLEIDFGPRWVDQAFGFELTYGLGFGVTWMRANEEFSDGLELNETLAFGARMRPYVSLSPVVEPNASRPFFDVGVAFFAGSITEYEEDYDSLVAGLEQVMVTPYARLGYLLALGHGVSLGTNYEVEVIGDRFISGSLSHRVQFLLRLLDENHFTP